MYGFDQFAKKLLLLIVACVAFYLINLNFLSKALSTYNLQSYVNVQMIIKCNNYWNVTDSQKRISDMVQNEYTMVKSAQLIIYTVVEWGEAYQNTQLVLRTEQRRITKPFGENDFVCLTVSKLGTVWVWRVNNWY